jgi:hypothetical protein
MKKVLMIVPDGTGVRNYLYSPLISILKKSSEISILTTLNKEAIDEVSEIHGVNLNFFQFKLQVETPKVKFYRESSRYARLLRSSKLLGNKTILKFNWKNNSKTVSHKVFNKLTMLFGKLI